MYLYWFIFGVVLMLAETVIPGMVLVFLGLGATFVAGICWLGWVDDWLTAGTSWFISSLVFIVVLRGFFQKFFEGESNVQETDEDVDALGVLVEVVERITPEKPGRISFRNTTWEASCADATLEAGAQAKILYRDNLKWVVEVPLLPSGNTKV